jgi:Putative auto-transporter adhesin, head GIN domain
MKQIFVTFIALVLGMSTFAQQTEEKRTETRNVIISSPITSITLNDGVNLVLIDDITNDVFIEGKTGFVHSVDIQFENGQLTISSTNKTEEKPVAVFVSARYLKEIIVNGTSIVGSYQTLQNNGLNITINGACKLMIRTFGAVNVTATGDYAFTYQSKKLKR